MVNILKVLIIALYEILPASPFRAMFDSAMGDADFLAYLNWFLPFDICANMMLAWLDCILIYYVFVVVKKILFDIIINNLMLSNGRPLWSWWWDNNVI